MQPFHLSGGNLPEPHLNQLQVKALLIVMSLCARDYYHPIVTSNGVLLFQTGGCQEPRRVRLDSVASQQLSLTVSWTPADDKILDLWPSRVMLSVTETHGESSPSNGHSSSKVFEGLPFASFLAQCPWKKKPEARFITSCIIEEYNP